MIEVLKVYLFKSFQLDNILCLKEGMQWFLAENSSRGQAEQKSLKKEK